MAITVEEAEEGSLISGYVAPGFGKRLEDQVLMTTPGPRSERRFLGDATPWTASGILGCEFASDTPATAQPRSSAPPQDTYAVGALLHGRAHLLEPRGTRQLAPGSLVIYPSTLPFFFKFDTSFRYVVFWVTPRDLSVSGASLERLASDVQVERSPFAAALLGLLDTSHTWPTNWSTATMEETGDDVRHLARRIAGHADKRFYGTTDTTGQLARVLEWIETHLLDEDLGPEAIAAAHHISLRHLHRLFSGAGTTCNRYITRRRLERIRQELITDEAASVAMIGKRWGFSDATHLSKAFRRQFGVSPREVQRRPLQRPAQIGNNDPRSVPRTRD